MSETGLVIAILITGLGIGGAVGYVASNPGRSLMQQCLDDGHKEYECHGIIYGGRRR